MVPRSLSMLSLMLLGSTAACGADFEVYFEPLSSAGSAGAETGASVAASSAGTNSAGSGSNGGAAAAGTAGASPGASNASGGSGQAGAAPTNAGATSGGQAGTTSNECAGLEPWQSRQYGLGERVISLCQGPYNGACPADGLYQFECRPATGLVGLGWCSTRQPGVGNGWHEAWLLEAACPNE